MTCKNGNCDFDSRGSEARLNAPDLNSGTKDTSRVQIPSPTLKKKNSHGFRNNANWRYMVIKKYKHRAIHFRELSTTDEEREAWTQVIAWFDSILRNKFLSSRDSICLRKDSLILGGTEEEWRDLQK